MATARRRVAHRRGRALCCSRAHLTQRQRVSAGARVSRPRHAGSGHGGRGNDPAPAAERTSVCHRAGGRRGSRRGRAARRWATYSDAAAELGCARNGTIGCPLDAGAALLSDARNSDIASSPSRAPGTALLSRGRRPDLSAIPARYRDLRVTPGARRYGASRTRCAAATCAYSDAWYQTFHTGLLRGVGLPALGGHLIGR